LLDDSTLLLSSALVWRAEGTQQCRRREGRRPDLLISVKACDKGLVAIVADGWGTSLHTTRVPGGCDPEVSELGTPDLVWRTEATGTRALQIVAAYKAAGILGREREIKLKRLEECLGMNPLNAGVA